MYVVEHPHEALDIFQKLMAESDFNVDFKELRELTKDLPRGKWVYFMGEGPDDPLIEMYAKIIDADDDDVLSWRYMPIGGAITWSDDLGNGVAQIYRQLRPIYALKFTTGGDFHKPAILSMMIQAEN